MTRHRVAHLAALLAVVALISACGPGAKERAVRSTLVGVNAARAAFQVWDASSEVEIVDRSTSLEQGQADLARHRGKSDLLIAAFEACYYSLALAAVDLRDQDIAQAAIAAAKLYTLYRALVGTDPPTKDPAP